VLYHGIHHSGYIQAKLQVGNSTIDTGTNYSRRHSRDGAAESTGTSENQLFYFSDGTDNSDEFSITTIRNIASQEKLAIAHGMNQGTSGAGNAPHRAECVGKWAETTNQINRIQVTTANTFASGSEIVILGCDDDEADSGTNFWQELASVDITSGDNHTTGTFTAKKWLMFTTTVVTTGGAVSQRTTFNDTTSGYAQRKCFDGGSENVSVSSANIDGVNDDLVTNSIGFATYYGVNVTNKEKLFIAHSNSGEASGGGTAPTRDEEVFKWTGSAQITKIDFDNNKAGDWTTGSNIRVWGSD
jgi:hypothetical protein